jgi:DNA-binding beta-propeller fold protein YncE
MVSPRLRSASVLLAVTAAAATVALPSAAVAKGPRVGALTQLSGKDGCVVASTKTRPGCATARALEGPGPFLGSDAIAVSPDGRNVYVAAAKSDAIVTFTRNASTGRLTQPSGKAGCVAAGAANGCARGIALREPNSVAVSPDGRSVYATTVKDGAVVVFHRNPTTGALTQLGCVANEALPGCTQGRALTGPDVVAVSPDGRNVYVGAFFGSTVAAFTRDRKTGELTQPTGATGCVSATAADGCATALALGAPEGLAISGDGRNVYVANATANSVLVLNRDRSTGGLTQASGTTGCIVATPLAGCANGFEITGANAVAVGPGDQDVYVTSLLNNSVTSFSRSKRTGALVQRTATACLVAAAGGGCEVGRALKAPEGVAVAPDGQSVYVSAFESGALDVLDHGTIGTLTQLTGPAGCHVTGKASGCTPARELAGVSSAVVSPDGRFVYAAAYASDAVTVFRRTAPPAAKRG